MDRKDGERPVRLLLVEDNADEAHMVVRALREGNYQVHHVRTGAEAEDAARQGPFHVVLLDHRLPDTSGVRVCAKLRGAGLTAPIILVSSSRDDETARLAFAAGATDYLTKGMDYGAAIGPYLSSLLGD